MPRYDIAVIYTVEAPSYAYAQEAAEHLTQGVELQDGETLVPVDSYEYDNSDQRVLYLHPENRPEEA